MNTHDKYDVVIIGAGMSGIAAGNFLQEKGFNVKLLDKGKGIGGRLATRRIQFHNQKLVFDYGAKYIEAVSGEFQNILSGLHKKDIVKIWNLNESDSNKKYIGKKSIREIALYLSKGLDIMNNARAVKIIWNNDTWQVITDDESEFYTKKLILTMPVPQSLDLLDHSQIKIDSEIKLRLAEVKYERSIAALLILEGESKLKLEGGFKLNGGPISFITDNNLKGINSGQTAITVEMSHNFSMQNWELSNEEIAKQIIKLSGKLLVSPVVEYQIHKWKYSRPSKIYDQSFEFINNPGLLYFAGDAFGGNNVESAYLSGLSAAENLFTSLYIPQYGLETK